jgi:hypothetical protein
MSPHDNTIRIDVLQRLAEQAMTDVAFRSDARDDLEGALAKYGYNLHPSELALVLRFRRSLEDAGVDLDLVDGMGDDRLAAVLDRLQRHAQSSRHEPSPPTPLLTGVGHNDWTEEGDG